MGNYEGYVKNIEYKNNSINFIVAIYNKKEPTTIIGSRFIDDYSNYFIMDGTNKLYVDVNQYTNLLMNNTTFTIGSEFIPAHYEEYDIPRKENICIMSFPNNSPINYIENEIKNKVKNFDDSNVEVITKETYFDGKKY